MRLNRLLYVLIGAALGVGLLVSVLVRAEPRLTASEDCYGLCPSMTALSLSNSTFLYGYEQTFFYGYEQTVTYGNEQVEKFRVKVSGSAPGTGTPTGYVVVESGTKILCSIHLYRGKGSCSSAAKALAPGLYKIVAHYAGDSNFMSSTSSPKTLLVLRYSSRWNPRHWRAGPT